MSFGFAVGDFIAVGALCWKVYTRVKDSPGKYAELASEVLSLYAVIKETGDDFSHQSLTRDERAKMKPCQRGCEEVLHDLDKLLSKYESLGTKSQRNLDRVGFGMQDMNAIRSRLISNVTMLNTFNNASANARLERKLNRLITEVRAGKREGSVVSVETFNTKVDEDQEAWDSLRRELEDVGVSQDVIVKKRTYIIEWFRTAIAAGQCEEDAPDDPEPSIVGSNLRHERKPQEEAKPDRERKPQQEGEKELRQEGDSQPRRLHPIDPELVETMYRADTGGLKKYLEEKGADDLGYDDRGRTALHVAARYANTDAVQVLLEYGADINAETVDGRENVLSISLHTGCDPLVKMLLERGANTEAVNNLGETPLMIAAWLDATAHIQLLLDYGAQIDRKDNQGKTALEHAAAAGATEAVELLAEMGANLDSRSTGGHTALLRAAGYGYTDVVSRLLERGANTEVKEHCGRTALTYAVQASNVDIVKILLEKGANTESKDSWGKTALINAAQFGNVDIVKILLEKGANTESKDSWGKTILMHAAQSGAADTLKELLEKGANTESKDSTGETALIIAAQFGNVDIVKILLQMGAKTQAVADFGCTALSVARSFNFEGRFAEVIRLLEAATPRVEKSDVPTPALTGIAPRHPSTSKTTVECVRGHSPNG